MKARFSLLRQSIFSLCTLSVLATATPSHAAELIYSFASLNPVSDQGNARMTLIFALRHQGDDEDMNLLIDWGDGTIEDLVQNHAITSITLEPNSTEPNRKSYKLTDFDGSEYRYVLADVDHVYADPNATHEVTVRNFTRDSRSENVDLQADASLSFSLPKAPVSNAAMAVGLPILPLEADKFHEYDLYFRRGFNRPEECRLLSAQEAGLLELPQIEGKTLELTSDCRLKWDTTGASVGQRFSFRYVASDPAGVANVVEQEILIVEDLDAICPGASEVVRAPNEMTYTGYANDWELSLHGRRLYASLGLSAREPFVTGEASAGATSGILSGSHVARSTQSFPSRLLGGTLVASTVRGDKQGSSVCPLIFDERCEALPDTAGPDAVADEDLDLVCQGVDNCPGVSNPDQADLDEDGLGDACDADLDGDGVPNDDDACKETTDPNGIMTGQGCTLRDACPCSPGWFGQWIHNRCVSTHAFSLAVEGQISWGKFFELRSSTRWSCI